MDVTAKEIMSTDIVTINATASVEEALKLIVNHKITGLPVVDQHGTLKGVISEYDLLKQLSTKKPISSTAFDQDIQFSSQIESVDEDTPLPDILKLFLESRFRRLPVLDRTRKLVGIITRRDLMKVYFYQARL